MGRHSMGYQPPADEAATPEASMPEASTPQASMPDASTLYAPTPEASIAPPGGPVDPGVPGAPDAPGYPDAPGSPDAPSTVPTEPPPIAPDEPDDGSSTRMGTWHLGGTDVL